MTETSRTIHPAVNQHAANLDAIRELRAALAPLLFEVEQILISTKNFPECAVKMSRKAAVEIARAALAKHPQP